MSNIKEIREFCMWIITHYETLTEDDVLNMVEERQLPLYKVTQELLRIKKKLGDATRG